MRLVRSYCSLAVLGIVRPYTDANKNCENAEQSTPFFVVPPNRYGVPYQPSMNSNILVFFTSSAGVLSKTEYFTWSCDKFSASSCLEILFLVSVFSFFTTEITASSSFFDREDSTGTSIWSRNFVSFLTVFEFWVDAGSLLPVNAVFKLEQLASNTSIKE